MVVSHSVSLLGPDYLSRGWTNKNWLHWEGGRLHNWAVESFVWCLQLMGTGQGQMGVVKEQGFSGGGERRELPGDPLGIWLA